MRKRQSGEKWESWKADPNQLGLAGSDGQSLIIGNLLEAFEAGIGEVGMSGMFGQHVPRNHDSDDGLEEVGNGWRRRERERKSASSWTSQTRYIDLVMISLHKLAKLVCQEVAKQFNFIDFQIIHEK